MKRSTRLANRLFSWIIRGLVKPRIIPETIAIQPDPAICYVLESDLLSNRLILEQTTHKAGLPSPLQSEESDQALPRTMIAIQEMRGLLFRRPDLRAHLDDLKSLLEWMAAHPDQDIQLVPVSIFLGRATDGDSGVFKILFTENWPITGRIRRFFSMMFNGRDSIVQFSKPISLRQMVEEDLSQRRLIRKVSRVLRVHFRRVRSSVLGPDLSHRRTLLDTLLKTAVVRDAIRVEARKKKISVSKARKQARKYAKEIAADYSYTAVRIASRVMHWFWNRIYNGVRVRHKHNLTDIPKGSEIIYVPCHRSHIDYLLVSWLVHNQGLVVPHIAAGVNLNLPVIGSILRRGGAFFIRRSFRSNMLYSVIFNEYVDMMFRKGVSMEYFIEGGRSRTGRLRDPSMGMLTMTVRSYLRHQQRPVKLIPVYLGYEKLVEGSSYLNELSGGQKKSESIGGFFRSLKLLREQYGRVHVSYGKPIDLASHIEQFEPNWRDTPNMATQRPVWMPGVVEELGFEIMRSINRTTHVNPINLIAVTLLSTLRNAMSEKDLIRQIDLVRQVILLSDLSDEITVTDMPAADIIAYAEGLKSVSRKPHALGDVIYCEDVQSWSLTYFRNNIMHLLTAHAWVACMFRYNMSFSRERLLKMASAVYPYLRRELFVPITEDDFPAHCERAIEHLIRMEFLQIDPDDSDRLHRHRGDTSQAMQLKQLSAPVFQSLERYFMTVAILVRNGPGTLSSGQLENLCHLCAERLSIMYSRNSPDFFDRALFKGFIRKLRDNDILGTDDEGKLTFGEQLVDVIEDAKGVLSKEVRHTILQISYIPDESADQDQLEAPRDDLEVNALEGPAPLTDENETPAARRES